jgi:hypothetical protein
MPQIIGNLPNQVPTNADLGTMAYREANQFYDVGQTVGFRNRIINGAMVIDQRNAGAAVSAVNGGYTLDRWTTTSYDGSAQSSKFTVQQNAGSVTPPTGFRSYLGITSNAATSVSSNGIYAISQAIEGFNMADLMWGTASASPITISFWVRSSLTGTFGGVLNNSSETYNYPFQYTILAANTWEYKTVTVSGATAGTWLSTNGTGVILRFGLGGGTGWSKPAGAWTTVIAYTADNSVSVVGTSGATFYITGVQLEKGSTATSFDYRPYGTEFQLCQRYYQRFNVDRRVYSTTSSYWGTETKFTVPMRASPTVSQGTPGSVSGIDTSAFQDVSAFDNQSIRTQFLTNVSGAGAYLLAVPITLSVEL